MYFVFSSHKSRADAEDALEHYFATGLVCDAERPYIQRRGNHYHVMFPA